MCIEWGVVIGQITANREAVYLFSWLVERHTNDMISYLRTSSKFCRRIKYFFFLYSDGAVRLTGGTRTNIGRVEVYYLGQWGTICQKGLDNATADVICRQLGYISAADTPAPPEFEFGRSSSPIHLDDVKCVGTESKLALCSHGPWGDNDCDHSDDLTLNCKTYSTPEGKCLYLNAITYFE